MICAVPSDVGTYTIRRSHEITLIMIVMTLALVREQIHPGSLKDATTMTTSLSASGVPSLKGKESCFRTGKKRADDDMTLPSSPQ